MTLPARLRVAWSYAIVILLLLVTWFVANSAFHSADRSLRGLISSEDLLASRIAAVAHTMTDQQASFGAYLVTRDTRLLRPYRSGKQTMANQFRLASRATDGPTERSDLRSMHIAASRWQVWSQRIVDRRSGGRSTTGRSSNDELHGINLLRHFEASTDGLLNSLRHDRATRLGASQNTLGISDVALSGTILGAILIVFLLAWQSVHLFGDEQRARRKAERAEEELRSSADTFRLLFVQNPHPMWVFDVETLKFLEVNAAAVTQYGYGHDEFLQMSISDIRPVEDVAGLLQHLDERPHQARTPVDGWRHTLKSGEIIDVEVTSQALEFSGRAASLVLAQDITERKRTQEALAHHALHDVLTDLPNRVLLQERLEQGLLVAGREREPLSLLLMDLDRFKEVNDTYGHHYGDLLLQQLAARLTDTLRTSDTIARLGGDEFALLLPVTDEAGAYRAADKILRSLDLPFVLEGQRFDVSASIGIAMYPEHGSSSSTLLQRADVAMYVAKRGGNDYVLYSSETDEYSPIRLTLIAQLRHAIEADGLSLHYQPKLDLKTGRIDSVEALVRWHHPELGFVPPDQFIPLAERTGLIHPLSGWVLNAALRQCRAWRDEGLEMRVAVNLSARNLHDPRLVPTIASLLRRWNLEPTTLAVELTETTVMDDPDRATEILSSLHDMGIRISIDDFGTGYSSLAYLRRLPVDEIKIDKSFVLDMATQSDNCSIVKATIGLGHDLGMQTVAEGVETQASLHLLTGFGCDMVQGYLLSRPLPAESLSAWLLERARKQAS